jgi:hypothetical protein
MSIALKAARETHYWLRLLAESHLVVIDVRTYLDQVDERIRILTSIVKTTAERASSKPQLMTQHSTLITPGGNNGA